MNFRIIAIAIATLLLAACIAGPTPHPAHETGSDPNLSNVMDSSLGALEDSIDNGSNPLPTSDVLESSDALESDAEEQEDTQDEDTTNEDSVTEDSVQNDSVESVDAG